MNPKLFTCLLGLSVLLAIAKTARAGDIYIQTNQTKVFVGADGQISIRSPGSDTVPGWRRSPSYWRFSRPWWPGNYRYHLPQSACHKNSYSYRNTQKSVSGQTWAQTQGLTSTMVCR